MTRWELHFVAAILFTAGNVPAARAQCAAQPAVNPAPAPAAAQDSAANPSTAQPPPKKVWTNEDMNGLDPHAGVSTVGNTPAHSSQPGQKHPVNSKNRDAKSYQTRLPSSKRNSHRSTRRSPSFRRRLTGNPPVTGKHRSGRAA